MVTVGKKLLAPIDPPKFENPNSTHSGRKVTQGERKKEEDKKKLLIVDTTFRLQRPSAAHALHSDQNYGEMGRIDHGYCKCRLKPAPPVAMEKYVTNKCVSHHLTVVYKLTVAVN